MAFDDDCGPGHLFIWYQEPTALGPVAECLVVDLSLPLFKVGRRTLRENFSLRLPVTHNGQCLHFCDVKISANASRNNARVTCDLKTSNEVNHGI